MLVDYFNKHFQFYGRKIVIDYFDGQGSLGNELVGNGRDKAEVDATKVAEEMKPFGDITALSEPFGDALARRGIMNFGTPVLSREWYTARRPYAWSVLPDCSTLTEEITEFLLKRLNGPDRGLRRRGPEGQAPQDHRSWPRRTAGTRSASGPP